jgi:hypothetical protein
VMWVDAAKIAAPKSRPNAMVRSFIKILLVRQRHKEKIQRTEFQPG